MKKILFISCIFLCALSSHAQTLIPKIGGTLSNLAIDKDNKQPGADYKNKLGLMVGVAIEFPISDMVSVQPELLFQQKGFREEYSEGASSMKAKFALNYLELPVLVKVNFNKFYLNVGPSFSYGIGGNYDIKVVDQGQTVNESGKVKFGKQPDNYSGDATYVDNAFDLGLQAGGGFKVAKYLIIDIRYGLGLLNIADKDAANGVTKNKSKNHSLQVSLGFPIKLGGK